MNPSEQLPDKPDKATILAVLQLLRKHNLKINSRSLQEIFRRKDAVGLCCSHRSRDSKFLMLFLVCISIWYCTFKSDLSLDKVYPNSAEVKPFEPPKSVDGKFTGYIPIDQLIFNYSRSSGPGGQNVNKKSTKCDLRFHIKSANWISEETKAKLFEKCYTRINKDGYLVIKSDKTRELQTNRLDAMTKLREIIFKMEETAPEPCPETAEKIRKRMEKAARERLIDKRIKSLKKRKRGEIF